MPTHTAKSTTTKNFPEGGGILPYWGLTGTYRWTVRWTGHVFFWRRCPEQGLQFYSPLS